MTYIHGYCYTEVQWYVDWAEESAFCPYCMYTLYADEVEEVA